MKSFEEKNQKEQMMELSTIFDFIKTLSSAMLSETYDQEERLDEKDYTLESIGMQRNFASMIRQLATSGFDNSKKMEDKMEGEEK